MALNTTPVEVLNVIPKDAFASIGFLITILQAAGIVFIIYLGFNIANTVLNRKRQRDIHKIQEDVAEIKRLLKSK